MSNICELCPRKCGAERNSDIGKGVCRVGRLPVVARAALHMWEEPCISGTRGSGTVFFSGCSLKCVFCQNKDISTDGFGKVISVERLKEIYAELISQGAHNINLVNPTHFTPAIIQSLDTPLPVPVVYNTGGYDTVEQIKSLDGKVDIYLPDMKYVSPALAGKYSRAENYPQVAKAAIKEMVAQVGKYQLDENGILRRGVVIRHLVLPGNIENSLDVIDWVSETFPPHTVLFSLMGQFTPNGCNLFPELCRTLTSQEYDKVKDYALLCGLTDGYFQELDSAKSTYTPPFDLSGI